MRFPIQLHWTLMKYIATNAIRGRSRYPFVLMLEPTHLCNLACEGCGKIREFESTIRDMLPLETCLKAVEECGSPIVSICGGEPTIYPHLGALVSELLRRKKFVYLCTNAIKLDKWLPQWKPSPYLTINISMDGLEPTHDLVRSRKGLYQIDIRMIPGVNRAADYHPPAYQIKLRALRARDELGDRSRRSRGTRPVRQLGRRRDACA